MATEVSEIRLPYSTTVALRSAYVDAKLMILFYREHCNDQIGCERLQLSSEKQGKDSIY